MKTSLRTTLLCLAGFITAISSKASLTYDLVSDFTQDQNPNGQWSYLWASPNQPLQLMQHGWSVDPGLATRDNAGTTPYYSGIDKNITGSTYTYNGGNTVQPVDVLYVDPQYNTIAIRWTAPQAGTWSVSGKFETIDKNFHSGYIAPLLQVLQGTTVLSSGTLSTVWGSTMPFSFLLDMQAGQTLDFKVACQGDYAWQGTGLAAQITAVPEPATCVAGVLMVLPLAVGFLRKR
jgi:hypothetical protein